MVEIENLSVDELEKLYSRYEAKLRIRPHHVMGYEFTIDNEDDLITDLGKDPFISTV